MYGRTSRILAAFATASCLLLEEVFAPKDERFRIIKDPVGVLSEPKIHLLLHATIWALVSMHISKLRENEEDWMVACTHVVGALSESGEFEEHAMRVMTACDVPYLAMKLHARYRAILKRERGVDGGFVPLILILTAAYSQAVQALDAD